MYSYGDRDISWEAKSYDKSQSKDDEKKRTSFMFVFLDFHNAAMVKNMSLILSHLIFTIMVSS